ncbi:MAG: hypothetical protein ACJ8C4_07050 [Gemmataceae bacterium]
MTKRPKPSQPEPEDHGFANPGAADEIIADLAAASAAPTDGGATEPRKLPPNHRIDSDFKAGIHLSRNAPKFRYEIQFEENPKTTLPAEVFAKVQTALKTARCLDNGHRARFSWKPDEKCWAMTYFDDSKAQCQQFAKAAFQDISDAIRAHKGIEPSLLR